MKTVHDLVDELTDQSFEHRDYRPSPEKRVVIDCAIDGRRVQQDVFEILVGRDKVVLKSREAAYLEPANLTSQ